MHTAFIHLVERDIVHNAVGFIVVIDEDVVSGYQGLLEERLLGLLGWLGDKGLTTHISQNQNIIKIQ